MRIEYGTCKYCNQVVAFETDEEILTDERREELASLQCSCDTAKKMKNIEFDIKTGCDYADTLLEADYPSALDTIKYIIKSVRHRKVKKTSVRLSDTTKVEIGMKANGALTITRKDSNSTTLETD